MSVVVNEIKKKVPSEGPLSVQCAGQAMYSQHVCSVEVQPVQKQGSGMRESYSYTTRKKLLSSL